MKTPLTALLSAAVGCALAMTALPRAHAQADAYPSRPISLIVPFAAGGPTDVVARMISVSMTKTLGQTVVVENRPGAGGTIASTLVARAKPDGYTMLIHHNGMATAPALYRKLPFDPLSDFEYVTQVVDVPMTLIGKSDLPPKTFAELSTYLKANADKVNLANAGLGAVSHLCGVMLVQALGVKLTTVPYQGTGPAMNALRGGEVDLLCDQTTQTTPLIQAGLVRMYGVTASERLPSLPDSPTLAEQGLKDFQMVVWHGIYAPKGTPKDVTAKFREALRVALKDPVVVKRMTELGAVIVPESKQSPEGLQTWLKQEIDRYGPVLKAAGQFAD